MKHVQTGLSGHVKGKLHIATGKVKLESVYGSVEK